MISKIVRLLFICSLLSFALVPFASAATANIVRGPYLQMDGPNKMIVRWRTDIATDSRVSYSTDPANQNLVKDDAAVVTEHIVTVTGLSSNTKYYYKVG